MVASSFQREAPCPATMVIGRQPGGGGDGSPASSDRSRSWSPTTAAASTPTGTGTGTGTGSSSSSPLALNVLVRGRGNSPIDTPLIRATLLSRLGAGDGLQGQEERAFWAAVGKTQGCRGEVAGGYCLYLKEGVRDPYGDGSTESRVEKLELDPGALGG